MATRLTGPGRLLMAACGVALCGYAVWRYGLPVSGKAAPGASPAPASSGDAVTVTVLYGTEKDRWLKAAVAEWAQKRPDVRVELKGLGTLDAVAGIAEGREKPTVFSPADEIALNLLDAEWSTRNGRNVVARGDDLAPQPLVLTPLVMIAWEERAKVLAHAASGDPTSWKAIHEIATSPRGWIAAGGPADWGFVKPGHTAPTSSNSGLQTLALMAYGYHGKSSGLRPEDVLDEGFQKWLREIEGAVGRFGTSSGTYMRDMILYGPSRYDLIWNYESVAISEMANAQGRWGNLSVYYPRPTLWSNHPFAVLDAEWVTAEQRKAARELRDFLLSPPVQSRALEFGFRPGNPEVKVVTSDPANPWNRLQARGLRVDVPAAAEPPSGETARLLLETWRRNIPATR